MYTVNHGIRTETEQTYQEAKTAQCILTSIAMQYRFPSKCMVPQVLTNATSETLDKKPSNLCVVPHVDANACKVAAVQDRI
jgi:hypothetical protein